MSIKSFAVASLLALSAIASTAQAAATWTVTTQGSINYGWDSTGVFGVANRSLAGLTYTQTITANVDPSQWTYNFATPGYNMSVHGAGPVFSTKVTVDGVSQTYSAVTSSGQQYLSIGADAGGYDYIYSYNSGTTAQGDWLYAQNYAYSTTTSFVPSLDWAQSVTQAMNASIYNSSYFQIDGSQYAYFDAQTGSITANGNVPEPASLALLGLGLAGVAFSRRKKALRK